MATLEPNYVYELPGPMYPWQNDIMSMIEQPPDLFIHWFWEEKGCTGKSMFIKYLATHGFNMLFGDSKKIIPRLLHRLKDRHNNFPDIICIDIFRCEQRNISYKSILRAKDMNFATPKTYVHGPSPHVFVFANIPPNKSKIPIDRFKIYKIVDNSAIIEDV